MPLSYHLNVCEDGIFGFGLENNNGLYIIRGDYNMKNGEFKIVKKNVEGLQDPVLYKGFGADIEFGHYLCGISASVHEISNASRFKIKGLLEPGPFMKKKIWWDWGMNKNMNAVWEGWYTVDSDKVKTKYAHQIANMQFAFFDYTISGSGEDEGGKYTLQGSFSVITNVKNQAFDDSGNKVTKDKAVYDVNIHFHGQVDLDKIYHNKEIVKYHGEFKENSSILEGHYKKISASEKILEQGEFVLQQGGLDFDGHFTHNGVPKHGKHRIAITANGILGIGDDELGPYILKGDLDIKNRIIVMAQNYLERRSLVMVGRWNIHKGQMVMRGTYEVRDLTNRKIIVPNTGGTWELVGKFG